MDMVARGALVGLGGALGAVARWARWRAGHGGALSAGDVDRNAGEPRLSLERVSHQDQRLIPDRRHSWPRERWATLERGATLPRGRRPGGYTTFSTFSYEPLKLLADGSMTAFLLHTLGQLTCGLIAVYLGLVVSRLLGGAQ
jgi:hypothetical protein